MYCVDDVDCIEAITFYVCISVYQVIHNLSDNKSTGVDQISAEHLKLASGRLAPLLSLGFTAFVVNGFIPNPIMTVLLVHVIKDKAGKVGKWEVQIIIDSLHLLACCPKLWNISS